MGERPDYAARYAATTRLLWNRPVPPQAVDPFELRGFYYAAHYAALRGFFWRAAKLSQMTEKQRVFDNYAATTRLYAAPLPYGPPKKGDLRVLPLALSGGFAFRCAAAGRNR